MREGVSFLLTGGGCRVSLPALYKGQGGLTVPRGK
jgi:hypothetical protein